MLTFNRTLTFRPSILPLTVCLREGTVRIWADQIFKATVTKCPTKMVTLVTAVYQIQCKDTLLSRIMSMLWGNLPWFALWNCASSATSLLKSDAKLHNPNVPAKFFRPTGARGRYKGRHERQNMCIAYVTYINLKTFRRTSCNVPPYQRMYIPTLQRNCVPTLVSTNVRTFLRTYGVTDGWTNGRVKRRMPLWAYPSRRLYLIIIMATMIPL